MINVKYIRGTLTNELTLGKTYNVIGMSGAYILLINDLGSIGWYAVKSYSYGQPLFVDVTTEYRNKTINEIL